MRTNALQEKTIYFIILFTIIILLVLYILKQSAGIQGKTAFAFSIPGVLLIYLAVYYPLSKKYKAEIQTRQILQNKLLETEANYQSVLAASQDAIGIIDIDGRIIDASPGAVIMFGYDNREEVTGRLFTDFITRKDRERISANLNSAFSKGLDGVNEYQGLRKDKTMLSIELYTRIIKSGEIQPRRMSVIIRDITENKRSEDKLRALSQIVDQSPVSVVLTDTRGNIEYVNKKFIEITGYTWEESIGKNPRILKTDFHPREYYKKMWDTILSGKEWQGDLFNKKKNGETYWENALIAPIVDNNGKIRSLLGIKEDITQRKSAEELLRDSEEQHRLLFETAQEGILVLSDSRFVYFNPIVPEITGYNSNELLGMSFIEVIHPDDREMVINNYKKRLAGVKVEQMYQVRLIRKDKSLRWVGVSGAKIEWRGQPATLNFIIDITIQKLAQLELVELNKYLTESNTTIEKTLDEKNILVEELTEIKEKLEKLISEKDKFFSIIAHDLRSPFQGFIGFTELMSERNNNFSQSEISALNKQMLENAKNLFKLLSNLLDWSRMQQGMVSFYPEEKNLLELISQNIDLMIKRGEQKGIEINIDISPGQTIYTDEAMFNSILRNLLSNAVKFTKQGGKVNISSKEIENIVEISVTDNGIGMPASFIKRLFKIEEQVGRTGTDGELSTGLGLLLCKEFVEKHSGNIRVESQEDVGSTFYFTLPKKD